MPGKIVKALRPAAMAGLAVLLLQACPAPVSSPQPTITEELVKDKDRKTIGTITVKKDAQGKVTSRALKIVSTLTAVPPSAFAERQLTAVTIPSTVTSIGNRAFADNKLTEVTIPSSVTSIGTEAFKGNPNLKLVNIDPKPLHDTFPKAASPNAFPAGIDFKDRLGGITRITTDAAGTTITAKTLEIPASLTAIPNGFGAAEGVYPNKTLTSLNFVLPSSLTSIGNSAFESNRLTSVTIPNSVTRIGNSAFMSNRLTSIVIPNSVITIETAAFFDNTITSVTIGNSVTTIGPGAFWNNLISSVPIPASVTTIGPSAFRYNRLTSVTIGNSVTTIDESAFRNNRLTSVTIPTTVTSIGKWAFAGNPGLTSVTISQALKNRTPANAFPSGVTFTYH